MSELLQIIQLSLTILILPALGYIIKLEKRLTALEVKIELIYKNIEKREGE